MAMARLADPTIQLQIDEAILDYLMYAAITTQLQHIQSITTGDVGSDQAEVKSLLKLVNLFLVVFRCLHPHHHGSADLQFRLRLLKFTTFSASRFANCSIFPKESALQDKRKRNRERAKPSQLFKSSLNELDSTSWTDPPKPRIIVNSNDDQLLRNSTTSNSDPRISSGQTSLLDSLPDFLSLSAAQIMLQATSITHDWMRLAADYMSHAVVEQVLVYGIQGPDQLQQAFAWGFDERSNAEEGSDDLQINAMFLGDDGAVDGWDEIREAHIRALVPPPKITMQSHFRILLKDDLLPTAFEHRLLEFLRNVLNSQSQPLLMR